MAFSFNGNTPRKITFNNQDVKKLIYNNDVVWEKERLPVEYQEVEYIESTGTQYIDTNLLYAVNDRIEVDVAPVTITLDRVVFGSYISSAYVELGILTSKFRCDILNTATTPIVKNVRYKVIKDGATWTVDGNTITTAGSNKDTPYPIYLFGRCFNGSAQKLSNIKVYSYKHIRNNVTIADLIPCYRKIDKVAGLYDIASGMFYTNEGTGEFNVGADVIMLPADYQRVEYIRSTGDGGQWIDTGVPGENSNLRIDVSYMWDVVPAGGSYQNIISAYINETSNCTRIIQYGAGYTYVDVNIRANRSPAYRSARVAGTRYNDSLTRTYYDVNGERLVLTETVTGSSNDHNLHLFSSSTHGAFAKSLRLYNCKLYDGNTIVRDFVPCYRKSDDVIGLYDLVSKQFYTNQGTGTFTKGLDVN